MKKIAISLFAVCAMLIAGSSVSAQVAAKPAEKVKTEAKAAKPEQGKPVAKHQKATSAAKQADSKTATTQKAAPSK